MDRNKINEIIEEQNMRLTKVIPQRYIYTLIYGLAWAICYGILVVCNFSREAYIAFGIVMAMAIILEIFYTRFSLRGVKSIKIRYNNWWCCSWLIGFLVYGVMMGVVSDLVESISKDIEFQLMWILGNSIPFLIVSINFLGGAALFRDKGLGILGIIIAIVIIINLNISAIYGAILYFLCGFILFIFSLIELYKNKNYKDR